MQASFFPEGTKVEVELRVHNRTIRYHDQSFVKTGIILKVALDIWETSTSYNYSTKTAHPC